MLETQTAFVMFQINKSILPPYPVIWAFLESKEKSITNTQSNWQSLIYFELSWFKINHGSD